MSATITWGINSFVAKVNIPSALTLQIGLHSHHPIVTLLLVLMFAVVSVLSQFSPGFAGMFETSNTNHFIQIDLSSFLIVIH